MPLLLKTTKWNRCNHWIKKSDGSWATVPQIYVKTTASSGSKWKPLYKYSWEVGEWGECSKTCNTGTQTRTVKCKRDDGTYHDDSFCLQQVGEKPATSQECNSHSCKYWYKGGYDDCATMHTWNGSGWRIVWSRCGAGWHEFEIESPDFGDRVPTPIRWEIWDTNGTSYHGRVRLCNTYNTCSEDIVYFPKQGECGGGVFYFTWDARNNAHVKVRCRKRNNGCNGCSACTDSGWGYLNCSSNYPDWAQG